MALTLAVLAHAYLEQRKSKGYRGVNSSGTYESLLHRGSLEKIGRTFAIDDFGQLLAWDSSDFQS